MKGLKFSLRWLLTAFIFVAFALVALLNANDYWVAIVFTLTFGMLLVSIVGAVVQRSMAQAFWIGFAVIGLGYFWAAHWPSQNNDGELFPRVRIRINLRATTGLPFPLRLQDSLITTQLLALTYKNVVPLVRESAFPSGNARVKQMSPVGFQHLHLLTVFVYVGHSLFTLLFAYIGGLLGAYFYTARSPPRL